MTKLKIMTKRERENNLENEHFKNFRNEKHFNDLDERGTVLLLFFFFLFTIQPFRLSFQKTVDASRECRGARRLRARGVQTDAPSPGSTVAVKSAPIFEFIHVPAASKRALGGLALST